MSIPQRKGQNSNYFWGAQGFEFYASAMGADSDDSY